MLGERLTPSGPESEKEYIVRVTGPTGPAGANETLEGTNKDIERLLKGLLLAFENVGTPHYRVQRAKTSIITTKDAQGNLKFSLGFGIFKPLEGGGDVKAGRSEGIEIEIERFG
ncbi:hypothetical protein MUP05_06825 [Candidatus Bathyarchaeota archaeon]|nr:hypothetical protein [Candidatus Bathyarchaeota archaeon]